jgi:hypothetical protein
MGCCVQRSKFEDSNQQDGQFIVINTLPTFENIYQVYKELELPPFQNQVLRHKKERLIFMIINMLRVKPLIFQ